MNRQMIRANPADGTAIAVTKASPARDFVKDWRRWSKAERAVAGCLLVALLAEIPILVVSGAFRSVM
jgi:hypothetical protein